MGESESHIAKAGLAISGAEEAIADLVPAKASKAVGAVAAARGKVPPVKRWWLPIAIIIVLFAGQALVAALVNDTTIGTVFAVGAVIVAVLTAIVAVLSYAQQAAVPLADIIKVLDELLKGLEELKQAHEEAHGPSENKGDTAKKGANGGGGGDTDGPGEEEEPTKVQDAP